MRLLICLILAILPVAAQAGSEDTCGASGFQGLVGQTAEIARLLDLDMPLRVIEPGMAVTMDFRPDRINFEIDDEGRIMVVRCG
ncbi:I78 family peptidase inhibitor [Roseicyclus marinus]|uniref:I78 family peptidase inhibitor n=1 Tax=Roseicyclus marinus TaxID=2161673 RepID=UPI00240FF316|nr:I78 family peptidase inhibitor [Roseicyclus marinus]MDG3041390.1 I78 family peptidase inhibitor [Roseicyclus marinus]